MNIALVIPPTQFIKNNIRRVKKRTKVGLLPHLGILYLSAILQKEGHNIKVIDAQLYGYSFADVINELRNFKPDIIGVSFLTAQKEVAHELIHAIKQQIKCILIVGGAHPICFPYETIKDNKDIDILIYDEGEYIVPEIIRCLESNVKISDINGIIYRKNNKIIKNPPSTEIIDLDKLPFPARHLLPIELYCPSPFENKKKPSTSIIVSRGCTYARCTFCYRSSSMKRQYRCQSVKKTIAEIEHLKNKYNIKELVFYDDDLLANSKWVNKFCNSLLRNRIDVSWSFRGRPCNATYKILKKAKQAGCWSIEIGFESGNQDLLDKIKKGITLEQSRNAARWCKELKIEVVGTFIIALPGEDYQKGTDTINFSIELDCSYAAFIPTHPADGTELYSQCLKEGKIIKRDYTKRSNLSWFIPEISYVPSGYKNEKQVQKLIKKAYLKFYFRPEYFIRHIKSINSYYDLKRYSNGLKFIFELLKC